MPQLTHVSFVITVEEGWYREETILVAYRCIETEVLLALSCSPIRQGSKQLPLHASRVKPPNDAPGGRLEYRNNLVAWRT